MNPSSHHNEHQSAMMSEAEISAEQRMKTQLVYKQFLEECRCNHEDLLGIGMLNEGQMSL